MGKERFDIQYWENLGLNTDARIIVDTETRVNYLFVSCGAGCGLTPLIDAQGKPIVSEDEETEEPRAM